MTGTVFFWVGACMFLTARPLLWWLDLTPTAAASAEYCAVAACNMIFGIGLRIMHLSRKLAGGAA